MARVKLVQSQMALREKTIEAVAALVDDGDVPEVLVDSEVNERLHDLQHRLEAQKLGLGEYLQATGRTPDDLLAAVRVDAQRAVKADLALRALAEAEELGLSDEELDAEIATMAERMETTPGRAAAPTRHGRTDRRGTLGATKGQGAAVAAGPRGALRRRGQPDVAGRPEGRRGGGGHRGGR